jgi:RsiW-degrading membrane proteinase PrsW (M82 family)
MLGIRKVFRIREILRSETDKKRRCYFLLSLLVLLFLFLGSAERFYSLFVSATFLSLAIYWYDNTDHSFECKTVIKSFLISGITSVLVALLLYDIISSIAFEKRSYYIYKRKFFFFKEKVRVEETVEKEPFLAFLLKTSTSAGPIEEFSKLFAVLLFPATRRFLKKGEKQATITAVACACGFQALENIGYWNDFPTFDILLLRADPAHLVFSGLWGRGLGRLMSGKTDFKGFAWYFIGASLLHSAWNYFASFHAFLFVILAFSVSYAGFYFIVGKGVKNK